MYFCGDRVRNQLGYMLPIRGCKITQILAKGCDRTGSLANRNVKQENDPLQDHNIEVAWSSKIPVSACVTQCHNLEYYNHLIKELSVRKLIHGIKHRLSKLFNFYVKLFLMRNYLLKYKQNNAFSYS
jgi:hypothetical protein